MRKDARACAGCGCRLSQYNLEDQCAACTRDRQRDAHPGPSIPDEVWLDPDIQTAIADWNFGLASRLIRERAGLRQDDMAFMTGLSQSFLSMLEAGGRRLTNLDKAARFLEGIGTPDALLAPPFREHAAPVAPARAPYSGPGRHAPWPATHDVTDLNELAAQAAAQSLHFTDEITKSNVSNVELEGLESTLAQIASDYVHAPLQKIFTDLVSIRNHLFSLLSGRQPLGQTRELLLLTGTSCLLLAHASQNLGDEDAAIAQLQTAWTFAEQADHNDLRAWVKGTSALIAEWSTRRQTALDYTRQAMRLAPGGETRIRIAAIEARAAARIGDRTTAMAALEDLQRAREQKAAPDALTRFGGLLTFPEAKQEYYIGGAFALLGEHHLAEQHATAAIELYENGPKEHRSYGDEALARLDIATARISAGEIEGAGEQLQPILELPADRRIRQLGDAMHAVTRLLEEPRFARSPVARDLADATRGYQAIDTRTKALTT
ncbi:helix-turn-helix domain-containing protein [Streptomyces sp. OK228]|uniref:helix-turn-helix domain-containing protein n=1 Tax=Streptomyces sp. OK228 TaxID=1882786 RepID=UPI000BDC340D|nr:helix-turn-helix transcriptional regulator [Streptomyces sp. OK228]SOE32514.1 Helix-turn-helix domain-containing protein [Streptomyces sp. OK228]